MSSEANHAASGQFSEALPEVMIGRDGSYPATVTSSIDALLIDVLRTIRSHLGMDVAFVSEFVAERRYFRYVDAGIPSTICAGGSDPLEETYCGAIVAGKLPSLMQDAARVPFAMTFAVTTALSIGAHISVPIPLSDGTIYGTLCCFKSAPDCTLVERDLVLVRLFAELAGKQIERQLVARRTHDASRARIAAVIKMQSFTVVYQPIYDLVADQVVGFESLARFSAAPVRPPNEWFDEAARVGLVEALEVAVIERALQGMDRLSPHGFLSLNVSPATVTSGVMARALERVALDRMVIEITEHVSIVEYAPLLAALRPLRERGLRVAVDDAGAGYASFRHILQLDPDIIKLDVSLTRDIDTDLTRRALTAALIRFAQETGIMLIAEGVETEAELAMLRQLHIVEAQGYLIGRPMAIADVIQHRMCGRAPRGADEAPMV